VANASPVRLGQINEAGDVDALFLKVYAGEVLTAFAEQNKFADRTMVRNISSGKSAQFPASWKANATYHTPGNEILGDLIGMNERVIVIDDLLISPVFIANIDEAKSHYDVRSEYSKQCGAALARTMDKNLAQVGLLAARASATVTGGNGGTVITSATAKTVAADLETACFAAAQALDEKDVPEDDRYVYLKPAQYYLLVNSTSRAINRDFNGDGSVADGTIFRIAGLKIVKTNNLPQAVVNTGPAAYQGTFTNTAALVMHRSAVGTVKLIDLAVEMAYDIRRQGTLVVSKYAIGHGILRPESSVEIKTA
jgi:Major capsid protein